MKIVLTESQYKLLLNEDLGVSRPVISYSNLIFDVLSDKVTKYINEKKPVKEEIIITLDEISSIWKNSIDDYIEFPIETIRIDFTFNVSRSFGDGTDFRTGGAAYQLIDNSLSDSYLMPPSKKIPKEIREEVDATVNGKFEFFVEIPSNFDESVTDELLYDLSDSISHETNHLLEFYNRITKGTSPVNIALSYAGEVNYNIPREIFEVWKYFTQLLYHSEPQEVNAMTQEMYNVRLRKSFEQLKEHKYWDIATQLENFNADDLFEFMVMKIKQWKPKLILSVVKRLYRWFLMDYYKYINRLGLKPSREILKSDNILELMRNMEPRINNAGKKLKRNFARLYSIETNN